MTRVMVVQGRELGAEDIGQGSYILTGAEPGSAKSFAAGGTGATHAAAVSVQGPGFQRWDVSLFKSYRCRNFQLPEPHELPGRFHGTGKHELRGR
jgi:hypothetical protein